MAEVSHPHPCNFHLARWIDRGWGEMACEYRWAASATDLMHLDHCRVYEVIRYGSAPSDRAGWHTPPSPPFEGWEFRNPTDGRTARVGLECFSASQGWAWDRHKLLGRLSIPVASCVYTIRGVQEYRYSCSLCGVDAPIPGTHAGPHKINRTFEPASEQEWRYSLTKHGLTVWMLINSSGYVSDSAGIGFGPPW
jgi:hypothetical protein